MNVAEALEGFRDAYAVVIAVAVAAQFPSHRRWVRGRAERRATPPALGLWTVPRRGPAGFTIAGLLLVACLTMAAAALWTAPLLIGAAIAAIFYFAQVIDLPAVRRKPNSVPIILLLLGAAALVPASAREWTAWLCAVTIKALIAQMYFSSALAKLRAGGWAWANGASLRLTLLRYRLRDGSRTAEWLTRRPAACRFTATLVLVFELTFWLVIPFPLLAWIYVPLGALFHAGAARVMRIHYWIYLGPAYLIFLFVRS